MYQSTLGKDSSVPLIHHDLRDPNLINLFTAQMLNVINTLHYAVGDCITILAMYENATKVTLNATGVCIENNLNKMA